MNETASPLPELPGIDRDALDRWFASNETRVVPPVQIELLSGGRSNLTYAMRDATGAQFVLRRPPLGSIQASAHDVGREWSIISAFEGTPIPVPTPIAFCAHSDVIGAQFFVASFVPGLILASPESARGLSPTAKQRIATEVVQVLAAIHAQDVEAIGLGSFTRPGSLVERQLSRWSKQLDGYKQLTSGLIREVADLLTKRVPAQRRTSVVHGDYKLGNLILGNDGTVAAVLDWELTAIGDPLLDLGWLLASWTDGSEERTWIVPPATSAGGFPDRAFVAQRYCEETATDPEQLDFYVAFAMWRWSCINEGILMRHATGAMGRSTVDPAAVVAQIDWQLEHAHALLTDGGRA